MSILLTAKIIYQILEECNHNNDFFTKELNDGGYALSVS